VTSITSQSDFNHTANFGNPPELRHCVALRLPVGH
jgi:hypothetical protein